MAKKYWFHTALLIVLLSATYGHSQTTTVTLQVTDLDTQTWNNGTWSVQLYSPPGVPCCTYNIAGTTTPVPNQTQNGLLSGTGGATFVLTPNASIVPTGTQWTFNVCPQAFPTQCFTQTFTIAGASQTVIINPPAIRINLSNTNGRVTAYRDIETTNGNLGSNYFNLIDGLVHVCTGYTAPTCTFTTLASTGASIPTGVANGSTLVSNGVGVSPAYQLKPYLEVRDFGVDCTGTVDSTAALNTIFGSMSGHQVNFPDNCLVKVTFSGGHGLVIQGQAQFVIHGNGHKVGTGGFTGPIIYGCDPAASGPVLYINRSGFGRIEGIGITARGPSGCSTSTFTGSVQIDSTGNPGVTTHDIQLLNDGFTTSAQGGGTPSNYIGVSITDGGKQNGEMIRVRDTWIHCQNSPGSIGIDLENGTSDKDVFESNNISSCFIGVKHTTGNATIKDNLFSSDGNFSVFGSNGGAIWIGSCSSGPINILNNELDTGGQFINSVNDASGGLGCTGGVNVIGNDMGISDYDTANVYPVNLGTTQGSYVVMGNQVNFSGVTPTTTVVGSKSQGTFGPQGSIYLQGNTFQNSVGTTFGFCCQSPGWQQGQYELGAAGFHFIVPTIATTFDSIAYGTEKFGFPSPFKMFRSTSTSGGINDDWAMQNTTDNFPSNSSSFVITHSAGQTGSAFIGIDGKMSGITLSQLTAPTAPTIQQFGTAGTTSYTYAVCAITAGSGQVCSSTTTTALGNSTLSSTNFNQIQTAGTAGAVRYCFYRTTSSGTPSSTGLIGCSPAITFSASKLGYIVNAFGTSGGYLFNDTGLAGDSSSLPIGNTTGQLVTSITGLTQCVHVDTNGVVSGVGVDCGSGTGGGLSGQQVKGIPYADTATTSVASTTPGTNQGTYVVARTNGTQGTATTPVELQVGDCTGAGTITGTTASYIVLYTDIVGCNVVHDIAGSVPATISIPTPITLNNPAPIFNYSNYSNSTDTLTPVTYTISIGHTTAAASLSVPSATACKVQLDPVNASTWKADCHPITTTTAGGSLSGMTAGQVPLAATATTVTSSKPIQGTDANLLSSGTVTGTGAMLCTDANNGATTSGCPTIPSVPTMPFYWIPYGTQGVPQVALSNQTDGTANNLVCRSFEVPNQITATKFTATVGTISAAQTFNIGIYDSSGNLIRDSGSMSAGTATQVTATVSSFTLNPGNTYAQCVAITDTVAALIGSGAVVTVSSMANKNATRDFACSNTLSAGAMPSTCGTATPQASKAYLVLLEQ